MEGFVSEGLILGTLVVLCSSDGQIFCVMGSIGRVKERECVVYNDYGKMIYA